MKNLRKDPLSGIDINEEEAAKNRLFVSIAAMLFLLFLLTS